MDPVSLILRVGVLPGAIAAVLFLLARWRGWKGGPGMPVAAAYVAGHLAVAGIPKALPSEAWQWLLPVAGAGGILAMAGWLPRPGRPALLDLVLATGAGSLTLFFSGTMLFAQLGGALAAGLLACFLCARALSAPAADAAPLAGALLAGLWYNGVRYAEMPLASALLLAVAPAGGWLLPGFLAGRLRPWQAALLRAVPVAVLAGAGAAVAVAASPPLDY